jgi:hypothetical protein
LRPADPPSKKSYRVCKKDYETEGRRNIKIRIYKTIILPVVLYGCQTWPLTFREKYGLRMFENRVLRRIFGLKRGEVTGGWRKQHNEELHNLYILFAKYN